jgi:hypothetical protein
MLLLLTVNYLNCCNAGNMLIALRCSLCKMPRNTDSNFHTHTEHFDIIKVLFIHQLMH